MKVTHPCCPVCGYRFDDEAGYDLVTHYGFETTKITCPKKKDGVRCGCVFLVQEVVERHYIVERIGDVGD